jgi:hypothetical protein
MVCPESGYRYKETSPGVIRCLDLDEEAPLPEFLRKGTKTYDDFRVKKVKESITGPEVRDCGEAVGVGSVSDTLLDVPRKVGGRADAT